MKAVRVFTLGISGIGAIIAIAALASMQATAISSASQTEAAVDAEGNLRVPRDYQTTYQQLGSWAVAADEGRGAKELHVVLTSPGSTITHFYRSPFPRTSEIVHLRAARPLGSADAGAGAVVLMSRPRGYFGLPRDVVLFDGKEPSDVKPGVPIDSVSTLRLPATDIGRPVLALFNQERIVARAWPASENRISIAELTC